MAIPWLTVLQSVPWVDVINNAPKVADGARKLWTMVARRPAGDRADDAGDVRSLAPAALAQRLAALETTMTELETQLIASAELIKALAEQNAQLIERVDANRARLRWLAAATAAAALAAIAALILAA